MNKKNKNKEQEKENTKELTTFFEKYKTDKKYKSKVQLIGYGAFIILLIIYLNITSMNAPSHGRITSLKNEPSTKETIQNNDNKKIDLLEKIIDNYEYDINVTIITNKEEIEDTKSIHYNGKSYKNNMEITKEIDGTTSNYYKIDSRYYTKNNETFEIIKEDDIYNIVEKEYIELSDIKEYINKSSLDHVTEYSSGKKEYVYHLKVKDIIKNYQETDEVEINITEENNILSIEIDYTNLMKVLSKDLKECKINYTYKNINTVDAFTIIEEKAEDNSTTEE